MKKFASVLLAVLVAFSMFSFVVSAAGVQFTVKADKTVVNAGDVVTVTVSIPENAGLATITTTLKYNAEAFKVDSIEAGSLYGYSEVNANHPDGARFVAAASNPPAAGGVLFTVKLVALKAMDSEISLQFNEVTDKDYNPVETTANTVAIKSAVVDEPSTDEPSTDEPSTDEPSTDDKEPCEDGHTWSTWAVTTAATCKKDGVKTRNCTICGEKETEAIAATGVCSYKWVVTKEATATEYGEKVLKCTMCGDIKETAKLAVKGEESLTNPSIPNTDAIA